MPELVLDLLQRIDTTAGSATGLPTEQEQREAWALATANRDSLVFVPDLPESAWSEFVAETDEWVRATSEAGSQGWPSQ